MVRPEFESITDYDEFCKYYWYREELIRICKAHGLKYSGSKIE
ncbi:MAG: SAP domain-containing protein, partial [Lachnospiraceae bacterium]|nr:SAP domain-containing protein [Eubacterium sp.]MCR5215584.1 SAP domain-containing protein [Lachnospiraceae bacterium]